MTYLLSVYLFTTELRMTRPLPEHFSKLRITVTYNERRLMKSALRILLLCTFHVSGIACIPIHKICALCTIFNAISVLLTTENSDDLEIRVPDGSRSLKVTPGSSSRVISY